jgi:hypothetical protein
MYGEGLLLEKKVNGKSHFYMEYRKFGNWGQEDLSLDNHFPMIFRTPAQVRRKEK